PAAMVDERIDDMIKNYNFNLSAQGLTFDKYLEMMGLNAADFKNTMRPNAEQQLRCELAFEKIAELEGIEITAEEKEEEYKKAAERYGLDVSAVKMYLNEDAVEHQLKLDKAREIVYAAAVATDKPEEKEENAEETAAE
ncbi:MAG: hypothetical protein IJP17_02345, partial [Clostridia bacterium]|nr:hypothetical protein [Clostridia bacterium]